MGLALAQGALAGSAVHPTRLSVDRYGLDEGLSQLSVTAIAQDDSGFLWIGTQEGLNRFDGQRFLVLRESGGLPSNSIESLAFDASSRLWVGTNDAGLHIRDLRNGGQTVLLNHANAPGTGDPANFDIEICRTQRNLSERGRHQARRIGALLAARSAPVEEVYTSRYCRARDTANLVFGEQNVETLEALDLISGEEQEDREAFETILELINGYTGSGNLFMVTHPENVSAWAGIRSREGEAIIVVPEAEGLRVTGRVVLN